MAKDNALEEVLVHSASSSAILHRLWTLEEDAFLQEAAMYLENPSFLMRMADKMGQPLSWVMEKFPDAVHQAVNKSLQKALEASLSGFPEEPVKEVCAAGAPEQGRGRSSWCTALAGLSGAVGGALGGIGLAVELPISTMVMMRSIASIARDYGEDLAEQEARLQCLAVLSHGGFSRSGELTQSSYLSSRASLTLLLRDASQFLTKISTRELADAMARGTAPRLAMLVSKIAQRFGVVVSQKAVAQSVPVIGALGGGWVNMAFADHFARVARFHFGIRQMERKYGREHVIAAYQKMLPTVSEVEEPTD
ncbi:MAG: EcsC family protein [Myxococcota bacterium]